VLSNSAVPRKGARVTVTGRMQTGLNVLGTSIGNVVRERDVRVH
jgi:hypothetical protein